jgi:Flavin containing amine oxidoreductase
VIPVDPRSTTSISAPFTVNGELMTILDVAIVGGGLSGLFVGFELGRKLKWVLFEASSRVGGRLINSPATTIDMGGAWVWPEYQPNMRDLVYCLSLTMFDQPGDADSTRIVGGAVQFIDRLCGRIQETRACQNDSDGCKNGIRLNSPITSCKLLSAHDFPNENNPLIRLEIADGTHVLARRVVFAVPPQLLSTTVSFDPPLSESKQAAMSASRTWMAGVTKVALVYPKRFWDASSSFAGLPSFSGPAFQVYDAGPSDESVAALTFFSHVPPESLAQSNDSMLANQVADQMANHLVHPNAPSWRTRSRAIMCIDGRKIHTLAVRTPDQIAYTLIPRHQLHCPPPNGTAACSLPGPKRTWCHQV